MGGSASPVNSNQVMTQNGVNMGGSMNYNGAGFNINNPAQFDASQLNPTAAGYVANNASLYGDLSNATLNPFNPGGYYQQLQQTNQSNLDTGLQNRYASMGLSGSSAEMGGIANADINNQMAVQKMQMQSQLQYAGAMSGINQQGFNDVMGVQSQYGNFEEAYNQSLANLLGVQQQSQSSDNALTGQIIGSVLGAGGMAAGGL